MKWFDRWFLNKCRWAWENKYDSDLIGAEPDKMQVISVEPDDKHRLTEGVTIHLKQVIGGRLVTFRTYDRKSDEHTTRTYIINEDQDFEHELGKIITLESMR